MPCAAFRCVVASRLSGFFMTEYWFKADLQFVCPHCKQTSSETVMTCAENNHDPQAVATAVKERCKPVVCQKCKNICPDGVQIQLFMNDLTPEELAKLKMGSNSSDLVM
jgi:hypothetical protein